MLKNIKKSIKIYKKANYLCTRRFQTEKTGLRSLIKVMLE